MENNQNHKDCRNRLLSGCGLKSTRQRSAILSILGSQPLPLAADEIYIGLQKLNISVNLSTVYRTLDILRDRGLIREAGVAGDSRVLYELNKTEHCHYLVCVGCKKITPLAHCPLRDYEIAVAKETRYTISGHRLDIYGYCPECQAKQDEKEKTE